MLQRLPQPEGEDASLMTCNRAECGDANIDRPREALLVEADPKVD